MSVSGHPTDNTLPKFDEKFIKFNRILDGKSMILDHEMESRCLCALTCENVKRANDNSLRANDNMEIDRFEAKYQSETYTHYSLWSVLSVC